MPGKKSGCLPLVQGHTLVGMVTEVDLLRYAVDLPECGRAREPGEHRTAINLIDSSGVITTSPVVGMPLSVANTPVEGCLPPRCVALPW
jgi:CBS domain-containing protein